MIRQPLRRFLLTAVVLFLAGCAALPFASEPPTPPPNPTPAVATAVPTAANTPIPSVLPTREPSATALPDNPTQTPTLPPARVGYIVLISLDGCRPDYLDLAELPNLRALMQSGTVYPDAWVGALDTNTAPGHTTMSTGSFPNRHAIMSFNWLSPSNDGQTDPTDTAAVNRGEMAQIVAKSGVPTLAALIKARYPDGKIAAVSSTKAYAAMALGMGPTDTILYGSLKDKTLTPAAVEGYAPPAGVLNDPRLTLTVSAPGEEDLFAARAGVALLEAMRPRALLLNLSSPDVYGHSSGGKIAPRLMRTVLENSDKAVGELVAAYRNAGIFDQTLWVITADHGMTPNTHVLDPQKVQDAASEAGLNGSGKAPFAYLDNPLLSQKLADAIAKKQIPGVTAVYYKLTLRDGASYLPAPSVQDSLNILSDATYRYLLSTISASTSPDVVTMTAEDAQFGSAEPNTTGSHGWITWGDLHIPLILSGPDVKSGASSSAPARLVDLLPTIARLMGLPGADWDGIVLADALQTPTPADSAAQDALNKLIAPLRDQLKAIAGQE